MYQLFLFKSIWNHVSERESSLGVSLCTKNLIESQPWAQGRSRLARVFPSPQQLCLYPPPISFAHPTPSFPPPPKSLHALRSLGHLFLSSPLPRSTVSGRLWIVLVVVAEEFLQRKQTWGVGQCVHQPLCGRQTDEGTDRHRFLPAEARPCGFWARNQLSFLKVLGVLISAFSAHLRDIDTLAFDRSTAFTAHEKK